ncbi:hypothetical protein ACT009_14750 [Sphingomonas sp. Tas61C01]|uniref:hypothetical protein n=1 Tax=Sphingomonas sp. Tas61C01 TaxID=3458297 RepID=UPI00403E9178
MKTLGTRLLHKPFLASYLRLLPNKLAEASRGIVLYQPGLTGDELRSQLEEMFCLDPLVLDALQSIRVQVTRRRPELGEGPHNGYIAEGRLPYSGSRVLWRARPSSEFHFPLTGNAADTSVGLRKLVPSMDLGAFAAELQEVLVRTRAALEEFAPRVRSYDEAIRSEIDRTVRSWL